MLSTSRHAHRGFTAIAPGIPSSITTKSVINHNLVILEVRIDVAAPYELRVGESPCAWIWCTRKSIRRDSRSRPEPYLDRLRRPLHSVDTPTVLVEGRAVVAGILIAQAASCGFGCHRDIVGAVCGLQRACLSVPGDGASTSGVKRG